MRSKKFQRKIENFTCENCEAKIKGNGYTNHCPRCLWSKHVDVNPGDRLAGCGGLMAPVGLETKRSDYSIIHRCLKCGKEMKNKTAEGDSFEEVIKLSNKN